MGSNRYGIVCLLLTLWAAACSTTRRLPEGETLYTGVKKMTFTNAGSGEYPSEAVSAAKAPLNVAPNNPLYAPYWRTPLPIGLWAYNYLYTPKEKGFRHWLYGKLAKEPVLVSTVRPDLRLKVVGEILDNRGYFGAVSEYELLPRKRNPQKARIAYRISVPDPYVYDSVEYLSLPGDMNRWADSLRRVTGIVKGAQYNLDSLTAERTLIARVLRNKGYYYFRSEYIEYQADTTGPGKTVDLRMGLREGVPPEALRAYRAGRMFVTLRNPSKGESDSMQYNGVNIRFQRPLKVRPRILAGCLDIRPGELLTVSEQNSTQDNLNRLGIFSSVNLSVTPADTLNRSDTLDIRIAATLDVPLEAEFEADVSSKSNSYVGPGLNFMIRNKNAFRGGEVFSVRLTGGYEWQTGKRKSTEKASRLNSYEFGINASLGIPRVLAPGFWNRNLPYPARTNFKLGADLMNRARFFHMISFNGSAAYDFQTSPYSFHSFTPFKLVFNNLLSTSSSFDETMQKNPAIALSFEDQFIPSMGYSYTFDKTFGSNRSRRLIWQNTVISAGNILSGVMELTRRKDNKQLFGVPFSQFMKGTAEARFYYRLGTGENWLVSRLMVGAGYAYGNSSVLPYSEQFYIGGANSIRAFTIRSLGPGSYRPPQDEPNGYLDQTGDFKLEANVELRFKLMGRLHGAVFLDAGNVWLLRADPQRPGGELRAKGFWREIALGTGFGLRYDISYLVLRADLGIGLHTPYPNPDKPRYYNIQKFGDGLGFHLAIGYPF